MQHVFQKQFKEQLLQSEKRRTLIIISIFLFGICYRLVNSWLLKQEDETGIQAFTTTWIFPALILLLELLFLVYLFSRLKRRKQIPLIVQYVNVGLEIGLLSVIVLSVAWQHPTYNMLQSPAIFIYFLFIILSTLRLNFWLSFFCGFLSASCYVVISLLVYGHFAFTDTLKMIIILLSGLAAGLVATQIRKGISSSLAETEKRHRVQDLFGKQISMEIAEKMLESDGKLESKRMNVAIMFIDIRNFSQFVAGKTPEEIVQYQNAFFTIIVSCVAKHNGIINQFLGDGCMITFGAPIAMTNPGSVAVDAALEIVREIKKEEHSNALGGTRIGIGIHTGDAVTGNIGTEFRQQYSITGNVVIAAARIEQLNKQYDSQVLVSGDVVQHINPARVPAELVGTVELKGMCDLFPIYKVA